MDEYEMGKLLQDRMGRPAVAAAISDRYANSPVETGPRAIPASLAELEESIENTTLAFSVLYDRLGAAFRPEETAKGPVPEPMGLSRVDSQVLNAAMRIRNLGDWIRQATERVQL